MNEPQVQIQGELSVGPYKGYNGRAEYDSELGAYHGDVIDTRDVITFVGQTPTEVISAFKCSIDDYLKYCESRNESPDKPFSGNFPVRISPKLHRDLSVLASKASKSLNKFVEDVLQDEVARRTAEHSSAWANYVTSTGQAMEAITSTHALTREWLGSLATQNTQRWQFPAATEIIYGQGSHSGSAVVNTTATGTVGVALSTRRITDTDISDILPLAAKTGTFS